VAPRAPRRPLRREPVLRPRCRAAPDCNGHRRHGRNVERTVRLLEVLTMLRDFPWRTALTIAITGLVLVGQTIAFRRLSPPPPSVAPPPTAPVNPPGTDDKIRSSVPLSTVFDDTGLDTFYVALTRTEREESVTRIVHYGDSPIT